MEQGFGVASALGKSDRLAVHIQGWIGKHTRWFININMSPRGHRTKWTGGQLFTRSDSAETCGVVEDRVRTFLS